MTASSATLEGVGLRSGRPASVVLHARPGPFAFLVGGVETPLREARVGNAERATSVVVGGAVVATVEHLLAACAALGLHEGLALEVLGGEVPLLDGGARVFTAALGALSLPAFPAPLTVLRDATLAHGESRYTFRRAPTTAVAVTLAYDDARIAPDAAWLGSCDDFVTRIAPARTFALAHEVAALVCAGHASHVDPASVLVFTPDAVLASGAPAAADEPARHKLLDLIGDLFLYGGPPRGSLHAFRPGHGATHAILLDAFASGVVTR